jgi:transposase InsO family protein
MDLGGYSFDIVHKKGKEHIPPDTLSRTSDLKTLPPDAEAEETETSEGLYAAINNHKSNHLFLIGNALTIDEPKSLSDAHVHEEQSKDPEIRQMIEYLGDGTLPDDPKQAQHIALLADQFVIENEMLYHLHRDHRPTRGITIITQKVIPKSLRAAVLKACHDSKYSAHLDVKRTYARVSTRYYWRRMYTDVKEYVESCTRCSTRKSPRSRGPVQLQEHFTPTRPWQYVGMDLLGPLMVGSTKYWILVFMCKFTKYPEAFAIADTSSESIAHVFTTKIVCRYGAPEYLGSDQASNVTSNLIQGVCRILNTKKVQTTAYNPQANGMTERFMSTLATMLSMYAEKYPAEWPSFLPFVLYAYRTAIHGTTGDTPHFLLYGYDAPYPFDPDHNASRNLTPKQDEYRRHLVEQITNARKLVFETLKREAERARTKTNANRKDHKLGIGDIVMWQAGSKPKNVPAKWWHPWVGPFRITKRRGPVTYEIEHLLAPGITKNVHMKRLKRQSLRSRQPKGIEETAQGITYRVLDTQVEDGKRKFHVQMRVDGKLRHEWVEPSNIGYDEEQLRQLLRDELTQRVTRLNGIAETEPEDQPNGAETNNQPVE